MPSRSDHLSKANNNENFVNALLNNHSKYDDWVIVGRFYAALHYIDAEFADENIHPQKHNERFDELRDSRTISSRVYSNYDTLYDLSKQARYKCVKITPGLRKSSDKALKNIKSAL